MSQEEEAQAVEDLFLGGFVKAVPHVRFSVEQRKEKGVARGK